ncbi:ATPase, T2SS/T4P/T4SS family [Ignatzschineria sp. F8392]|uniref:ATPase, T2SS/T4P/T4SS family n=1 Tax=Ignatzschineria sp. F8392 TaxID=1980117 RepID=UPI0013030A91|nr:ATPase, T2SS/T4P/T4SS family [Ignatzschineria sp. F8392]
MKLEHNPLIQGLIELKWMAKEAIPLLSAKMYENERSVVGKLRAHGLTSQAIFEAALAANSALEEPLPVVDLAYFQPIENFDFVGFATKEELLAQYGVPLVLLPDRLVVVTADPGNEKFFDTLALRYPGRIEYWLGDSDQIKAMIDLLTFPEQETLLPEVPALEIENEALEAGAEVEETAVEEVLSHSLDGGEAGDDQSFVIDNRINLEQIDTAVEAEMALMSDQLSQTEEDDPRAEVLRDSALDLSEIESQADDEDESSELEEMVSLAALEESATPHSSIAPMAEVPDGSISDEATPVLEDSTEILESVLAEIQQETEQETGRETEEEVAQAIELEGQNSLESQLATELAIEESDGVVDYLNFVLLDAITQKASDIHFEPYESSYRVRFRIDGILHKVYVVPEAYRDTLASRLKVMAELDIAEKRLPQDGHITLCLEEEEVDARISVIPTLWGEKVVIRLLDNSEINYSLNKIGLTSAQKSVVQSAIERSQGLILVTGPTGSGKTVTLYACLNYLNDVSRNIATVEDPIEINLEGINQLQVHPKIGLTFAEALRAFLRQDPDVLMVGEIRDYETADITIKAAQTGHLVLSTLHTKSAVESLVRLKNMGVEPYNIASTVDLVIAQRLVRELCHCKEEDIVDSAYLETLGFTPMQAASKFYRASGCSECHDGYRGRFAIFEVMPVSKRVSQLLLEGASPLEIAKQAEREGVKNLRTAGIEMVLAGRTALEEILRVTTE